MREGGYRNDRGEEEEKECSEEEHDEELRAMGCYRQLNVRIFTVVERGAPNWRRRRGVMKEGKERATPPPLFSLLVNKVRHLALGSDRCHNLVLPKEWG